MNTQGIGLGLVISENIIKAFNGNIGVRSKHGKGTKFVFSIVLGNNLNDVDSQDSKDFYAVQQAQTVEIISQERSDERFSNVASEQNNTNVGPSSLFGAYDKIVAHPSFMGSINGDNYREHAPSLHPDSYRKQLDISVPDMNLLTELDANIDLPLSCNAAL